MHFCIGKNKKNIIKKRIIEADLFPLGSEEDM